MSCKQLFFCVNILQFLAFGAAFFGSNNLDLLSRFRTTFEQNIGLEDISSTKKSTISLGKPQFMWIVYMILDFTIKWQSLVIIHCTWLVPRSLFRPGQGTHWASCSKSRSQTKWWQHSENAINRASFVQVPSYRSAEMWNEPCLLFPLN